MLSFLSVRNLDACSRALQHEDALGQCRHVYIHTTGVISPVGVELFAVDGVNANPAASGQP